MQKILITGYTGFIGSNLTQQLSNKILHGVDLTRNNSVSKHYSWEKLNECSDCDCIIHLAGKAHDTANTKSENEYFDINVGLTRQLFQHFLQSSASKFIFFSSVKAVADSVKSDILTEEVLPDPHTSYGKSKLAAEEVILHQWAKWKEAEKASGRNTESKKVFILRPCMIHGPGNKGNLNLLYNIQQKGFPWPLGAFENRRSFCSIDNLVFVVKQLIDNKIETGIYQVADDEALSTNELICLLAAAQHKKARIWFIPSKIIETIARFGNFLPLPLNSERLKKLTESYLVSNQKIKRALGIDHMPVTAIEGLKKTFQSFQVSNKE